MELNNKIRSYIEQNFIVFDDEIQFTDSDNIFELGFVNSLFAMKLLTYVEQEFKVIIENSEIDIKNFNSVDNIVKLLKGKMNNGEINETL